MVQAIVLSISELFQRYMYTQDFHYWYIEKKT